MLVSRLDQTRVSGLGGGVDFDEVVHLIDQWLSSSGAAAHPFMPALPARWGYFLQCLEGPLAQLQQT